MFMCWQVRVDFSAFVVLLAPALVGFIPFSWQSFLFVSELCERCGFCGEKHQVLWSATGLRTNADLEAEGHPFEASLAPEGVSCFGLFAPWMGFKGNQQKEGRLFEAPLIPLCYT